MKIYELVRRKEVNGKSMISQTQLSIGLYLNKDASIAAMYRRNDKRKQRLDKEQRSYSESHSYNDCVSLTYETLNDEIVTYEYEVLVLNVIEQ